MRAMDGLVLHEYEMRVGWGKAVPLPAVPLYDGKVRRAKLPGVEYGVCWRAGWAAACAML